MVIKLYNLYNLWSDTPNISSTHLAPYIVITLLLTTFPALYFTSPWLFCDSQLIFDTGARQFHGDRIGSSRVMLKQLDIHVQKNELGPLSHTVYKIKSKLIKNLNTSTKTIKVLNENHKSPRWKQRQTFMNWMWQWILDMTLKVWADKKG